MKNAKNAPQDNIPVKKEILIIIIYNFNLKIVDPMGMTCKACISDRMECQGGDRIIIKAGFWRPHNLSDQVEECKNNKANCLESELYSNFNCREGYTGALCEACDLLGETTANGT